MNTNEKVLGISALVTALVGSICCIVPVLIALLGIGSASLFSSIEFLRPVFILFTVGLIGFAFFQVHQKEKHGCKPDELCSTPQGIKKVKYFLYIISAISVIILTFPYWFPILFN